MNSTVFLFSNYEKYVTVMQGKVPYETKNVTGANLKKSSFVSTENFFSIFKEKTLRNSILKN